LETVALPIELTPYINAGIAARIATLLYGFWYHERVADDILPGLPVLPVMAAARAVFHQLHAAGIIAAVLFGYIVSVITLSTSQGNDRSDCFLCHE
jgi:hypothetical protein